jgi:hypothetical protein
MLPSLIFIFSIGALVQFAFAYCRSLLLAYAKVQVSEHTLQLAGLIGEIFRPHEFGRLMALVDMQVSPGDDGAEIRVITFYHELLRSARILVSPLGRGASTWFDRELSLCTHFAAVTLDRRLSVVTE